METRLLYPLICFKDIKGTKQQNIFQIASNMIYLIKYFSMSNGYKIKMYNFMRKVLASNGDSKFF